MTQPPSICPKSRLRCGSPEICWLIFCAKGQKVGLRPMRERDLTQAEKYALAMAERGKPG